MPGSDPLGRFRGWGISKMKLILNIVMLHIIKGTAHDSNMIAIIQHAETPLTTEEGGQKVNAFSP